MTLFAVASPAKVEPSLPAPEEVGSHAAYVEALRDAEQSLAADLLARYERRIAEAPRDAIAAVERCRFLAIAFYDPETEENPREEERQACLADMEQNFADEPAAMVFVIEESWGEDAREAGEGFLAEPPTGTHSQHLAAVHAHLARLSEYLEPEIAVVHAEQAMALDPTVDLRLLVAKGKRDSGDSESARAVLLEGLLATSDGWMLEQKASLLVDLKDFDSALMAFREAEQRGGSFYSRADYARALAGAGEIDAARGAWAEVGDDWISDESLRARFDFELAYGNGATARSAYDALQARGWDQDPIGRDRLALLFAHPDAPWKWEDAIPLVVLALVAFCVSLVPALWILPVAWAGLARNRSAAPGDAAPGFGLHHAWAVSALFLLAQVLAMLHLDSFTGPNAADATRIDRAIFAHFALVSTVTALAAALLIVRQRIVELLRRGRWSWRRTALASVLAVIALGVFEWLLKNATGSSGSDPFIHEMVRSVNDSYGLDASLFLMAMITPLTEEIVFRGVLLSAFQRPLGPRWANITQAALFGLIHADPLVTPFAFVMGLIGGWMTRRSGTLWPALLMHALNNALACAALAARA